MEYILSILTEFIRMNLLMKWIELFLFRDAFLDTESDTNMIEIGDDIENEDVVEIENETSLSKNLQGAFIKDIANILDVLNKKNKKHMKYYYKFGDSTYHYDTKNDNCVRSCINIKGAIDERPVESYQFDNSKDFMNFILKYNSQNNPVHFIGKDFGSTLDDAMLYMTYFEDGVQRSYSLSISQIEYVEKYSV